MTDTGVISIPREEYEALIARNEELEDRMAALDADDGSRVPFPPKASPQGRTPLTPNRFPR